MKESKETKKILTKDDVIPCNNFEDITDMVCVVCHEIFKDEAQDYKHQLILPRGGFGVKKKSRGNAVFAIEIYSGETYRYERYDLIGVLKNTKVTKEIIEKLENIENKIPFN